MRVSWVGLLSFGLVSGCALARGAFIEPSPPLSRAGVLELRWRRRTADLWALDWRPTFHGAPAVDPGRALVYAGSVDHGLYAIRCEDGALAWRFETLGRVDSTPSVDGDQILFGADDGALYSVDADQGALRWRFPTPAEVNHTPIVIGDAVYFVNANDSVYSIGRRDGLSRWRYRRNPAGGISLSGHAGLARVGNRLYAGFSDGAIVCLDAADGAVLWEQDTSNDLENIEERNEAHEAIDVDTTPVVIGDTVYAASFTAGLYALDSVGGGRRWRAPDAVGIAALASDGQYLYAASSSLGLLKIDAFDGSILWARELGSRAISGAVALGHDMIAVPTSDRALWIVRASDGEPIDGIAPGRGFGAPPAVAGDRIYAESNGGVLYAFRVSAQLALRTR